MASQIGLPKEMSADEAYIAGVADTSPAKEGQFLLIISGDDGSWLELTDESTLSRYIDGSDYLPITVESIYVLQDGQLVKCEFGDTKRIPYPDPENESSLVYAHSALYAGDERVATISLTDH